MMWMMNSMSCLSMMMFIFYSGIYMKSNKTSSLQNMIISLTFILLMLVMMQENSKGEGKNMVLYLNYWMMGALIILVFSVTSMMWFFVLFEASMVPIFIIIMMWGNNPEKMQASFYMMVYTLMASLPFLFSMMKFFWMNSTKTNMTTDNFKDNNNYPWPGFIMIFLVKMPCFLLHLWLPKAHVEAPVTGSMILAGVLLKLGSYGLFKFIPLIYCNMMKTGKKIMVLGVMGTLIISVACCRQTDLKIMIAYSSVSHMSTAASAIVSLSKMGMKSAFLLMVAHGLCSSGLFFSMNLMYKNINSRNTQMIKGYTNSHPSMMLQWFLVCAMNMAAPPSINFNSEITMLSSIMTYSNINSLPLILASMMVGIYCIMMFTFSSHGKSLSQYKKETRVMELLNQASCNKMLVTMFFVLNYL